MTSRPKFTDLTPEQQTAFGNGLGPWWLSDWARRGLTSWSRNFFITASWRHHDFGYAVGGDRFDRARCDWKFFIAMTRDAVGLRWLLIAPALILSVFYYTMVRSLGWLSFNYQDVYSTLDEIIEADVRAHSSRKKYDATDL